MAVKRIQNSVYAVKDVDRARAFYEGTFGLGIKFQDGTKWAQFGVAGANFSLASPEEAPSGAAGGVVVFEVDDLAPVREAAARLGGSVLDERDMGAHGYVVTIRDSEGNIVQAFQKAAG
jgi:predicted enzyme related to lactoylglutathione lyase